MTIGIVVIIIFVIMLVNSFFEEFWNGVIIAGILIVLGILLCVHDLSKTEEREDIIKGTRYELILEGDKMKPRQIHRDNQTEKDRIRKTYATKAMNNFITYINDYYLNNTIDMLSYPSDFTFFKTRAELFVIKPSDNNNSEIIKDVCEYFTLDAIYKYLKQEIPKKAPTSRIKVKLVDHERYSYIVCYYKGEK